MRLLVVEDADKLAQVLKRGLEKEGYAVDTLGDGRAAQARLRSRHDEYDLVLLDVMLPGLDGFEVLRRIRASSAVNVLLLTARGEDVDRIVGLEIGADDYLSKPFNPRELLARVRAIMRRSSTSAVKQEQTILRADGFELNLAARSVLQNGKKIDLTDVEFGLLEALMRTPGKVVSREEISENVLGRKFHPFDRSLDMHVSRLRRKLTENGAPEEQVKTIRGVGYQLAVNSIPQVAKD